MYIDIFCSLWEKVRKNPEKWRTIVFSFTIMLHHTGRFWSQSFPEVNNGTTLKHTAYYPDLTPADFYLFPRLDLASKGRRFCDSTDIRNAMGEPKRLSKKWVPGMFPTSLQSLAKHVDEREDYFEENIANMIQLFWFPRNI